MIYEIDEQLEPLVKQLKDSTDATVFNASLLNDALESVSIYESEANEYHINKIAFEIYLEDRDTLQAGEVSILENIINQCPSSGGKTVYEARALYNKYVNDSIVFEDDSLCMSSLRTSSTNEGVIKAETEYCRIYPNPANQVIMVDYYLPEFKGTSNITLSDITGRPVLEKHLKKRAGRTEFDISQLNDGLYFLFIKSGNKLACYEKLVITH